jgi:integrase
MPQKLPPDLSTRATRKKLAPRDPPYWSELEHGLRLGYRKGTSGAGVWVLREFKADRTKTGGGSYVRRRLGLADDLLPADGAAVLSHSDARKLADSAERPTLTRPGKYTVSVAYEDYCAARKNPLDERELSIWQRFVEPTEGGKHIAELTKPELDRWLVKQVSTRGKRGQVKGGDEKDLLRRAQYTANRRWNLYRAILNYAFEADRVPTDTAWRKVSPFPNVDRPRTVTATAPQARKLLTVIADPLLGIASGALYTGLRLSELNRLRVDDVDIAGSQIRVRHSKGGKERFIPLTKEGAEFFSARVVDKLASAPVFVPMSRIQVSRGMQDASAAAKIAPRVTMHDLRRSYGSLMLNSGAPIEIIQQTLGHADLRMTRRAYAHLLQKTVAKSVRKHLPNFAGKPKI